MDSVECNHRGHEECGVVLVVDYSFSMKCIKYDLLYSVSRHIDFCRKKIRALDTIAISTNEIVITIPVAIQTITELLFKV